MWTVVIFLKDNTIETIPVKWLIGNDDEHLTYWPAVKGLKLNSLIANCSNPEANWNIFHTRFPNNKKKIYDNFRNARKACSKMVDESDVLSENDISKRIRKRRILSSSDDDETNISNVPRQRRLPTPPAVPKKYLLDDEEDFNASEIIVRRSPLMSRNSQQSSSVEEIVTNACSESICMISDSSDVMVKSRHDIINKKEVSEPSTSRNLGSPSPIRSSQIHDRDTRIMRQLVIINHKLDTLSSDVASIMEKINKEEDISNENNIENLFPLQNDADVNSLEEFLNEDRNYKTFVQFVCKLGGATLPEAVRRSMERVFSDDFIQLFSWFGQKQKKIFGVLKVAHGLKDGIKKNHLLKDSVTEASIEMSMRNWIRHAGDRIKKRAKKSVSSK